MTPPVHLPVLVDETLALLALRPGQVVVDGTLGGGGHARRIAEQVAPGGLVIGVDRDPAAVAAARRTLADLPVRVLHGDYRALPELLGELHISAVDAVLLDLGLSSDQLADTERGFSFDADGPLDLRFDPQSGEPAWRLLERVRADELADMIYGYSDERFSRRIARRIVECRPSQPIRTARQLAELVRRCVPRGHGQRIDPATRTFQALRIAVNDELGALQEALARLPNYLKPGGRLAVISFHSAEDRLVKEAFRTDARLQNLTKKPLRASADEAVRNPRSRSARLRGALRQLGPARSAP